MGLIGGERTYFFDMVTIDNEYEPDLIYRTIVVVSLEQDNIGWNKFVEGKISRKWSIAQEMYYRKNPRITRTGTKWAEILVRGLYGKIRAMWLQRNSILHEKLCKRA